MPGPVPMRCGWTNSNPIGGIARPAGEPHAFPAHHRW